MKITDIAKKANLSKGTISKVINGYPNVSAEVREKVNSIIKELNYVPNSSARSLAGKKNKIIGLFVYDEGELHNSHFFQSFVGMTVDNAEKNGYNILVSIINSQDKRDKILEMYNSKMIDGGIFIGMKQNEPEIDELIEKNSKIALIDYLATCEKKNVVLINSNNYFGAEIATEHLTKSGCKNILHISGDLEKFAGSERLRGFKNIIKKLKIKSVVLEGNFNGAMIVPKLEKFFLENKNLPDGIFCANDETAVSAIECLEKLKYKVGKEIKVVGYDNIQLAAYIKPTLTTIDVDLSKMSFYAVDYLVKKITDSKNKESYNYDAPVKLIQRQS